ncbi:MAG: tRNA 2-thiouridine synthesizing protein [Bacteroidota bacterium]|nr:tRNA 2-thiouridine synthesizing protein [Bacteroidota bacterium]
MKYFKYNNKRYKLDPYGFLIEPKDWDENFVEGMAPNLKISALTEKHWDIIRFIRKTYEELNSCPLVYVTCRNNNIGLVELKNLFPSGYQRGACKLAGLSYRAGFYQYWLDKKIDTCQPKREQKIYHVDIQGFLVNADEWDFEYAENKAKEMKIPGGLTQRHEDVINYIRLLFYSTGEVPTIYDMCEHVGLTLDELEQLYPDGYHRGAVKIAGLRIR